MLSASHRQLASAALAGLLLAGQPALASYFLVAEPERVVREYKLSRTTDAAVLELTRTDLRLTVSGKDIAIDVPALLKLPGTNLRDAVLALDSDGTDSIYLLIPCGTALDRSGPAGSIVIKIVNLRAGDPDASGCVELP